MENIQNIDVIVKESKLLVISWNCLTMKKWFNIWQDKVILSCSTSYWVKDLWLDPESLKPLFGIETNWKTSKEISEILKKKIFENNTKVFVTEKVVLSSEKA
jgi:hypothetical protein